MSSDEQYDDLKWVIETLLEISEEHYPKHNKDEKVEDCVKIFEQYYD